MPKMFTCSVEIEMMAVAEDADDAQMVAWENLREQCRDVEQWDIQSYESGKTLAIGWDSDSLPYSDINPDEKTVGAWIDELTTAEAERKAKEMEEKSNLSFSFA